MYKFATAIGIEIGRTGINYGVVRQDGAVLWHNRIRYSRQRNKTAVLRKLFDVLDDVLAYTAEQEINPLCIGIGSPGFVDLNTGYVRGMALHIRDWLDIPLAAIVLEKTGFPVFVDNDANLQGYAEWMFGVARDVDDVIFITLRTGIGGAIIINKKLYRGNNNASGEFGQMTINFKGPGNIWGGRGSLESYASSKVLVEKYNKKIRKQGDTSRVVTSAIPVFERFKDGEPEAMAVVEENARFVGVGLGNLVNIFSPSLIVVGGGMSQAGDAYIELIRKATLENTIPFCQEGLKILPARLQYDAGFIGAGHFALSMLDGKIP
ncbi:MAG: ROK family protein [Bacteroidales bacterium]|nr:ROK family protein [Bacteroidales bacterium]